MNESFMTSGRASDPTQGNAVWPAGPGRIAAAVRNQRASAAFRASSAAASARS